MSFDLGQLVEELAGKNLRDYQRRSQAVVEVLAEPAGLDGVAESERFAKIMAQLRAGSEESGSDGLGALQSAVVEQMPNVVEFVLTYAHGTYQGFGYLSEGKPQSSLPATLRMQLENALRSYLSHGGAMVDAGVLADVFALVFPNLDLLAGHSPMAQAMLLGFVPRSEGLGMKAYFNTRLLGGSAHRERIVAFLYYLGLDGARQFDALYNGSQGLAFAGVGLDLGGSKGHRAKLYVRVPKEKLETSLRALIATMGLGDAMRAMDEAERLLQATEGQASADEVELAIGLGAEGYGTLKLTVFFMGSSASDEPTEQVAAYLASHGYPTQPYLRAVGVLSERVASPGVKKQPVHALGIEYPVGDVPKVNVYLTPML